ncbi:MAG TPA: DUF6496 domain-containing protein [Acetobacteraceae bacterium]|nr:DUF6496 domain-containing protein [Acetobacteraceae bacterium]
MAKQSSAQKETVGRVMHEWKHGELESSRGGKVKSRRQAVAIALSESGSSNQQSPRQNRRQLSRTKSKERRGETAQQEKEGRGAMKRNGQSRGRSTRSGGKSRAELYQQAMRRKIPGRSRMNKAELQRALTR